MVAFARFVHIASIAFWTGSTLFLFVLAPAVFAALPRSTAGEAMNAIFPRFYALSAVCAALAMGTMFLLPERTGQRLGFLVAMIVLLVIAGYVLGPKATQLRLEVIDAEVAKSADLPALRASFGKLHGIIMLTDLVMLLAGFGLLWMSIAPLGPVNPKG